MALSIDEIERQYYTTVPILRLQSEIELVHRSTTDASVRGRSAFLLGLVRFDNRQYSDAQSYFAQAKEIAIQIRDDRMLSDALHGQAMERLRQRDFKTTNELEEEALQLAL